MNTLYPIFLKTDRLRFLIIGGGEVGEEKLTNLLKSSPQATVRVVAPEIRPAIVEMADRSEGRITLIYAPFDAVTHAEDMDIAIAATSFRELNLGFHKALKAKGLLVNVADTPDLCDFYMCSIVTKGDLKIGISTNGKSPTFAKRFRQVLEEILPEEMPDLLDQLRVIRDRLAGDFMVKVRALNELTAGLVAEGEEKEG